MAMLIPLLITFLLAFQPLVKSYWTEWKFRDTMMNPNGEALECLPVGGFQPIAFDSHDQALIMMASRWKTRTIVIPLPGGDRRRVIDAWDGAVAHQVFYGAKNTTRDVIEQVEKDEKLLEKNLVRHVIWHFFEHAKTRSIGPSPLLIDRLRQAGIGILIYPNKKETCLSEQ